MGPALLLHCKGLASVGRRTAYKINILHNSALPLICTTNLHEANFAFQDAIVEARIVEAFWTVLSRKQGKVLIVMETLYSGTSLEGTLH